MRAFTLLLTGLLLTPPVLAGEVTEVTAEKPAWRKVALQRTPKASELVVLRIGIREASFHQGRHIVVDVPTGPAFVTQIMRDPKAPPSEDGMLWFDGIVPAYAFNSTHPDLKLRFLLDEGCKPGEAVPPGRGPLQVAEIQARVTAVDGY